MKKPELNGIVKPIFRFHNKFGGNVVDFLYDARDAEGNVIEPREDADDGHGRWHGIECGGEYTMFAWTHSRAEGGETEYGTEYKDDAVAVMEDQLKEKADLCREAEGIARNYEGDDGQEKLDEIKSRYDALKDWGTPKDAELAKRFGRAVDSYAPRAEIIKANKEAKLAVMAKVEEIEKMVNFKEALNAVRGLKDELFEIGSAGEENDREYRQKLNDLEKDIERRRKEFFENRDTIRAAAKEKKEDIIESAGNLLKNVSNWKDATGKLNDLFNDWKAAGSAGHEEDDALWAKFNAVRDEFYAKRKEFFDERNEKFRQSVETKKKIIAEAAEIAEKKDYSRENTERMKQLDVEWRAAGYSGREDNDRLWEEFSSTKETFWDGKRAIAVERFQKELDEKNTEKETLTAQIEDLKHRIEITDNPGLNEGFQRDIQIAQSRLSDLENAISALKDKING